MLIGLPCPAAHRSMIFCDESSQGERFFVIGAVYFALKIDEDYKTRVANIESELGKTKKEYGLFGRIKWEKVPAASQRHKLDGYKKILNRFAVSTNVRFKCIVIDT